MEQINNSFVYGIGLVFILALLYVWNDSIIIKPSINNDNDMNMNINKDMNKDMNMNMNRDKEFNYKAFPNDPRPQPYQQPILLIEKPLVLNKQPERAWGEYPIRNTTNSNYPYKIDKELENNHFFSDYYKTWWQPKTNGRYGDWRYRNPDWFPPRYVRQPELENRMTDTL